MNADELEKQFYEKCEATALAAAEEVLKQLTPELLQEVGREVVLQWVRGNITKHLGAALDALPIIMAGAAEAEVAENLLKAVGVGKLTLKINLKEVIDCGLKVREAKMAEAQAEAKTEGQSTPDAAFQTASPEEETEEEVPTEACQPMFSAEDVCEGSAEGEAVTPETEGGAL